jgi:tetratricopeptide (TPR) repeat protein
LGAHHPNLALGLNNLALLHYEQGAYLEAQALLRRALAIEEEAYGRDDPALIVTLENYARVVRELGRTAEADELDARVQTLAGGAGLDQPALNGPAPHPAAPHDP